MYPIAVPSCVLPANVAENAYFLAHKVQEVGLCLFETKACLDYTQEDLPLDLQALPLRWHVHLPVDLPWKQPGAKALSGVHAARKALAVFAKAAFLRPRYVVLHPPTFIADLVVQGQLLKEFLATWHSENSCPVLLENIQDMPLYTLPVDIFEQASQRGLEKSLPPTFGICLDVGHMLAFGQEAFMEKKNLLEKVRLVHWSAPGDLDDHKPLSAFTEAEQRVLWELMPLLPAQCTHMIEVFHWQGIEASFPYLQKYLARCGANYAHKK